MEGNIIYNKNFSIGKVDRRMFGSFIEHLGRCLYNGIYQPDCDKSDKTGFRTDVEEMIKELGISVIRYPGGNFVSGYDWKDGIGLKNLRPIRKDMAWNVIETNEVGLNEFMEFMNIINTDAIMTVNLGTGSPKEAAELVEYCNLEEGTYWSNLRQEHGIKKPYNIKIWCLGNEMDGFWQINSLTAKEYAKKARETSKMMKWIDPNIELIFCGSSTNEEGHKSFGDWDLEVLETGYEYIDYISLHRYYNYYPEKQMAYPNINNITDIPFFFSDLDNYIETITSACDFIKGKKGLDKTIYISFDEWGLISNTSSIPGGIKQEFSYSSFKLIDSVIYGGLMCTLLNHADRVKIACQSLLVNEGGMISTMPNGRAIRQATYYPFKDVAMYGNGVVIKGIEQLPKAYTEHHGEQKSVVMSCIYNEEEKTISIFLANLCMDEDVNMHIKLEMFDVVEGLLWSELYNDDINSMNTFDDEFAVLPKERKLPDLEDSRIDICLKKHSWNVLRYKVR